MTTNVCEDQDRKATSSSTVLSFFLQLRFPGTPLNWVPISLLKAHLLKSNMKLGDQAQGIQCPDQIIFKIGKNQLSHPER